MPDIRLFRTLVLFCAFLALVACGGGGSGGGSSDSLTASTSAITFTSSPGSPLPPTQTVQLSWSNPDVAGVVVGYPPDVTVPTWLDVNLYGSSSPLSLDLSLNTTNLSSGTYTTTVRAVSGDSSANVLGVQDIAVTLVLTNKLAISSSSDLSFNMVNGGSSPIAQSVRLIGTGIDWTATASASWVQLGQTSGTGPSTLTVGVDPSGMGPGVYNATVDFSDVNSSDVVTLNIQFTIDPNHLAINGSSSLPFAMVNGDTVPADQTVDLIGYGVDWTATASDSWVQLSATSGTAPNSLTLGVDPTGLAPGDYSATVDFVDSYLNETATLNVQLKIEPHRLYVNDNGVALASMPTMSRLSYTVKVADNGSAGVLWSASSNQSWLSATSSGDTAMGDVLVLTADPAGLAADTIHYATVTVDSSDLTVAAADTIRVGFWVGSADANTNDSLSLTYTEIATDPIRPLVYMHAGGTDIDVYNVHTATFVKTIANVGAQLGDMEISSDGSTLYVADLANYDIVPVDLDTDAVGTSWDLTGTGSLWLAYGRNQGRPLVFASNGSIRNASNGSEFSTGFRVGTSSTGNVPSLSQDGETVCGVRAGVSPYTAECHTIDYSDLSGGSLTLSSLGTFRDTGSNAKDIAVTPDGSRVYVASGAPYTFVGIDTATMTQDQTLPADAYPNCVEIGSNGLLYGGTFTWYGPKDLWVYSLAGVEQGSYYISGYAKEILDRQLAVSGDGLRVVVATSDPKVVMQNSP